MIDMTDYFNPHTNQWNTARFCDDYRLDPIRAAYGPGHANREAEDTLAFMVADNRERRHADNPSLRLRAARWLESGGAMLVFPVLMTVFTVVAALAA
jgi:hypothetical protein